MEMERKNSQNSGKRAMLMAIFTLAWPTMLEQLLQTAVQYIDTGMVGSLGTRATAAVGSTGTVSWMLMSIMMAIGVGMLAYISQAFGAREPERAKRASGQAALLVLATGAVLTVIMMLFSRKVPVWMRVEEDIQDLAARYFFILCTPMIFRSASIIFGMVLRAAGDTKTPMKVGVMVNILNVILNYFLIYDAHTLHLAGMEIAMPCLGWGVEGAAIASAISYAYGGIAITYKVWKHQDISPKGQSMLPDMEILKPCTKVAFPYLLQRFGVSLGFVFFASMINSLGAVSTAAHTIANTVESAFYIPGYGVQTAAATLSGNALGAKDQKRLKDLVWVTVPMEVVMMVISGGLLFIFAPNLMRFFSKDPEVISLGATVLRMVAVSEPFYGVSIVLEGIMQGLGKTIPPFIFNVTGIWCVRITGTYICTQLLGMGLISAWGCMIGHNTLLFVLFVIYYALGKWNPLRDTEPVKAKST